MKNKQAKSIFSSLENFSSPPPPELWANIEAELDKPKKKKRPVIWWWTAACLVAGLSLPGFWYINSNQGNNNQELNVVNSGNAIVLQNESKSKSNANTNANEDVKFVAKKSFKAKENNSIINESLKTNENSISVAASNSATAKTIPATPFKANGYRNFKNTNGAKHNQQIAEDNNKSESAAIAVNKNAVEAIFNEPLVIGVNNFSSNKNENTKAVASIQNSVVSEPKQNKESVKTISVKPVAIHSAAISEFSNKAIAENGKMKDSLDVIKNEVAQLENALAGIDKDKTKKKTDPKVIDKWSLQVFAGVTGSENYNNEKALGNTVASKQSSGYGVKTNYKLNKKWAVSSGFKINELGQKIDGVAYYDRGGVLSFTSGILPNNIQQDNPSQSAAIVFVSDNENYLFASNAKTSAGFETGNVTQNLKYFEMPLEISYELFCKNKTTINMNTGGFVGKLIANEVLLNGGSIGENNNVNEFVYGTSLSSTLQYEFYKKTKFFIEPGMNYYINPLENQSFNQFQWMFNVGVNVSF